MDAVSILNYIIAFFSLFVVSVFLLLFLKYRNTYLQKPKQTGWKPLVSVIMPAYNEGVYIADSIKSVLASDYPKDKLDIIIVDDGSTDNTYEIAKTFEKENPVRVFKKENGGKGAALNFGIEKAKGELTATMDADSYLTKDTLKELIPYFTDLEVMAVTPAVKIKQTTSWISEFQRIEYLMILFSRKLLSFIDCVPVTPGPFSMFRTGVLTKVGGFDEHNLVEDQEIALRIQANNYKIKSSMSASVYTEPPSTMWDLLRQRVRWQRGGVRNYWKYRFLIKPEYGDFGVYFIPLNFATLTAFFVVLGLLLYSLLSTPYYVRYIWFDVFGLGMDLFTFVAGFVIITSLAFLYLSVKSFKNECIKLRYMITFIFFYWYLMVGYNVLFLIKELRKDSFSW